MLESFDADLESSDDDVVADTPSFETQSLSSLIVNHILVLVVRYLMIMHEPCSMVRIVCFMIAISISPHDRE